MSCGGSCGRGESHQGYEKKVLGIIPFDGCMMSSLHNKVGYTIPSHAPFSLPNTKTSSTSSGQEGFSITHHMRSFSIFEIAVGYAFELICQPAS